MAMASVSMMQKAKLLAKGRWRPDKMVSKKMPDGSALLAALPRHGGAGGPGDDAAMLANTEKYCAEIDGISSVFGAQKRSATTAAEHHMYGIPRFPL